MFHFRISKGVAFLCFALFALISIVALARGHYLMGMLWGSPFLIGAILMFGDFLEKRRRDICERELSFVKLNCDPVVAEFRATGRVEVLAKSPVRSGPNVREFKLPGFI